MKLQSSDRAKAAIASVLAAATLIGGIFFVNQPGVGQRPAAVVLAETALVRPWESTQLRAYQDIVGVWTICDGDTQNVKPGMVETPAGCDARLDRRMMHEFYPALVACVSSFGQRPVSWQAMMLSLSWNIGAKGGCGSTAAKLGRAMHYAESCQAATAFNKAGGHVIVGLVSRRENGDARRIGEGELCVSGLTP